jgi:pimeloyl-ACP methyl ester carboxylesterase
VGSGDLPGSPVVHRGKSHRAARVGLSSPHPRRGPGGDRRQVLRAPDHLRQDHVGSFAPRDHGGPARTGVGDAVRVPTIMRQPSRAWLVTEPPRAGLDLGLAAMWPLLTGARRGDGHPVLVLPGLLTGDPATTLLRSVLRLLGHNVSGWSLGTNRGASGRVVEGLRSHLDRLHQSSGQRVSLVGWSLGGLYAQELARAAPGSVRGIITLGSPVVRWAPWVCNASGMVDRRTRLLRGAAVLPRPWAERGALRVPATSVYSRADGIVHWSACKYELRPGRENVEVRGSHLGLGTNPAVLWLLADRLGMAEGAWTPFRPPTRLRPFFPRTR